jgi:hypothetical protein
LVWLKRLAPFVVLGLIALAWYIYDTASTSEMDRATDEYAFVTAQVWVASARYRQQPEQFIAWRDSLLTARSLSLEKLEKYFEIYKDQPEEYFTFVHQVRVYVDSLFLVEDSLRIGRETAERDSAAADSSVSP